MRDMFRHGLATRQPDLRTARRTDFAAAPGTCLRREPAARWLRASGDATSPQPNASGHAPSSESFIIVRAGFLRLASENLGLAAQSRQVLHAGHTQATSSVSMAARTATHCCRRHSSTSPTCGSSRRTLKIIGAGEVVGDRTVKRREAAFGKAPLRQRPGNLCCSHRSSKGPCSQNHFFVERKKSCAKALGDRDIKCVGRP
jgi:hypothetical protein